MHRKEGAHEHWMAAGLVALLVLAHLWPVLIGGRVLTPTAGLYFNIPWEGLAPPGVEDFINRQLEDVTLSYYPWHVLARTLLHAGTFPAWNTHALAGTPFFANPELAWLSPFSALLWILPLKYALGLVAALKLWLAGFGTYLLVRELRLGFWPALLAGVSFALCAFDVVWLAHGVQVSVAVLLPWTLWLVERVTQRGRAGDGLALAAVATFVLTGGHPGTQLHVLSAAVLYALARTALSASSSGRERLRRLGLVGAALAIGVLVTAITLLPAREAAIGSAGAFARRNGSIEFAGADLPFDVLRTALFPDWWGRMSEGINSGPANYNERTFYAGVVALVLALAALLSPGGWRRKAPFVGLAALGVAVPLRLPVIYPLVKRVPLFDQVQNQRMLLWFLMAVAVLAAFGLQALLDAPRRWRTWIALGAVALAALAAVMQLDPDGDTRSLALRYLLHRTESATEAELALASIGWAFVFVAALGILLLLARLRPGRHALIGGLVVLIAALDLLHFAHGYQPMAPSATAIPPRTPAIAYLQRHAGDGRMAGIRYALISDFSTIYGLRDARGYDQPQPSLRFLELWRTVSPEQTPGGDYLVGDVPSQAGLQVLGLLGARYLVAGPGMSARSRLVSVAYHGKDATILENRLAMGRAIVPSLVSTGGDAAEEIAAVAADGFDPRSMAVVRRDQLSDAALPAPGAGAGRVRVVSEQNASVTLHASLTRRALVVLDDAWAPGWSVEVDGRPARALQADVVLRGVVVPAGSHQVVWRYRVPGLRLGALLSGMGLLLWVMWAGWLVVCGRRGRQGPSAPTGMTATPSSRR